MCDKVNQLLSKESSCNQISSMECPCSNCAPPIERLQPAVTQKNVVSNKKNPSCKISKPDEASKCKPKGPAVKVVRNLNIKRPNSVCKKTNKPPVNRGKCLQGREKQSKIADPKCQKEKVEESDQCLGAAIKNLFVLSHLS